VSYGSASQAKAVAPEPERAKPDVLPKFFHSLHQPSLTRVKSRGVSYGSASQAKAVAPEPERAKADVLFRVPSRESKAVA
jgi:hypothetical protein